MKIHKINTTLYCISKSLIKHKMDAKVLPAKIIGYQTISGKLHPILKQGKNEINPESQFVFDNLEEAVKHLKK